jgi:hypothetical protein
MSALIRLYPRSWRDRYEPEFLGLLEARPPSTRDRLDIVRGALDARLNLGSPRGSSRLTRVASIAAIAAGALWIAWLVISIQGFDAFDDSPIRDPGLVLSMLAGLTLSASHVTLGLASADRMRPWGGIAAGIATIGFAITAFGGGSAALFALAASIAVATAVAGRTLPIAVATLWIAATVAVYAGLVGLVATNWRDQSVMNAGIPYGVAWILIGLTIALRGMPLVDRAAAGDASPRTEA